MANTDKKTRRLVVVGLMAALVFVFTYIRIEIPTPLGKTMLHLGNVMCLLSAFLLGPLYGGLSAGLGSLFFDLFDPVYFSTCWVTFILKFAMAFVCGAIAHGGKEPRPEQQQHTDDGRQKQGLRQIVGAICGALCYTALYLAKTYITQYLIEGYELETVLATMVTKGTVSLTNALIAVAASLILNSILQPALKKSGLADKLGI